MSVKQCLAVRFRLRGFEFVGSILFARAVFHLPFRKSESQPQLARPGTLLIELDAGSHICFNFNT